MYAQTMNNDVTLSGGENPLLAGRYQVVRPLGAGGMGSVYLVEDTLLDNKLFAVKMLPPILVADKRAYRQLKNEALVAMKLVHPNIMQIRAFEENNGNPFLVMDYIEGQTLDDYIADKGTLTEEETVRLLKPVAAALGYAHGEGVVHRDIKPANVMIRKDGRPFVLDFGIAREMQETMTRVTGKFSSGTLLYMSPEQLNGEPPASAQDVYSFAAMVYECLKGEPPFIRGQIEYQILNNPPPPLPDGMSSSLVSAVMRGLAKKPEERPETCGIMLNADGDIKSLTQQAIKAYADDNCELAYSLAQKADNDNPEIQYIIGRCFRYGHGVDEDCIEAMQWYRKAAGQGNVNALYEIGDLYSENTFDPYYEGFDATASDDFIKWLSMALKCKSPQARNGFARAYVNCVYRHNHPELELETKICEATDLELIRIAAGNGYAEAQYQLGCKYESGSGVTQSYTEAVKWFHKAAEQSTNYYYAEKLGELYKKGLGVTKDYDEAIKWYRKAVESMNNGRNVIKLAETYELAGKYQEAVTWYRKAAERGIADAQCKLGVMYSKGQGVSKDDTEACKWYLKAAEQGNVNAQHDLGGYYYLGKGVAQDYAAAAKWLRMSAEQGNADAQRVLGVMYMEGQGFEQNYEEAVAWFQKAVEQGYPVAYFDLAAMYEHGYGVTKDTKKAFELYLKSAELGYILAQQAVAYMYKNGRLLVSKEECVGIDLVESVKWYRKAAEQGDARAQNALANYYITGDGVVVDYAEAARWYQRAAEQGEGHAQYMIGSLLQMGKGVGKNEGEAVKWYRKAAEQGNAKAQFDLGKCLSEGKGTERNQVEAAKWYSKAAEQGNAEAQYSLGLMYWCGNGVAKDEKKAIPLVQKAAEQGNSKAQDCLGLWYFEGMGVAQDYAEASKWFKKAAEQGEMASQYYLAKMYYNGTGVAKDFVEAVRWFRKLADRNHIPAQYALGVMYCNGEGVEQNYDKGIELLNKSATGGDEDAQYALGVLYEDGDGTTKDTEKAMYWYRKAAEHGHEEAAKQLKRISAEVKQQLVQREDAPKTFVRSMPKRKLESNQNTPPAPPDSQFSTGKKSEYHVNGVDYVDVSGKGLLGTMLSSFFAGLSGKGVVTGWDKMSGTWDEMKRNGKRKK